MDNYFIVNSRTGKGLSEFHPNQPKNPFIFKSSAVMSFPTIESAETMLQSIITRTPEKYKRGAMNLRVSMYVKGF